MRTISAIIILTAIAVAIPAIPTVISGRETASVEEMVRGDEKAEGAEETAEVSSEPYKILDCNTGQINEVSVRDYVIGAVAAEMPASFESEALKAQAVAAHTYAERQRRRQIANPTAELYGADLSNDPNKYQSFFTKEQMMKCFGENYSAHYKKIAAAADEVLGYILMYDDEPIIAAFHSMSSGRTESAENVWGLAVDYLVPVDSRGDKSAPRYTDEVKITRSFLRSRLEKVFEGAELGDDAGKWLVIGERSPSGTVLTVTVGDTEVTGGDIREAFGLRSADFEVEIGEEDVIFTTHGFGHGVGMSQYGANDMAKNGSTWKEILSYYYPKTKIVKS